MASKLGFILSLFFVVQVFLFAGDLMCIEAIRSNLDALSLTASYQISMNGRIDADLKNYISSQGASIQCVSNCTGSIGDTLTFRVYRDYEPIVVSNDTMVISVTRSAVVGYYM